MKKTLTKIFWPFRLSALPGGGLGSVSSPGVSVPTVLQDNPFYLQMLGEQDRPQQQQQQQQQQQPAGGSTGFLDATPTVGEDGYLISLQSPAPTTR